MRFLLDESADARIVGYLFRYGHDAKRVAQDYPAGLPDDVVLALAYQEDRTLIANDRHFGRLVFVERQPHAGVILFRLGPSAPLIVTLSRLDDVLAQHAHELDRFIVVTHERIRVRA